MKSFKQFINEEAPDRRVAGSKKNPNQPNRRNGFGGSAGRRARPRSGGAATKQGDAIGKIRRNESKIDEISVKDLKKSIKKNGKVTVEVGDDKGGKLLNPKFTSGKQTKKFVATIDDIRSTDIERSLFVGTLSNGKEVTIKQIDIIRIIK